MQTIQNSARGLGLMLSLNWDRLLYLATILLALTAGASLPLLFP
ncbi:MAG: hypothetical protein QUV10_13575 [Paracoccaceae bacterium]|jgi:hypothetical protein|nr:MULTISPECIES: hypothetical protein [unclassified Seohaeicola]MDD9707249.1 hypothetical protein [Seohaeicola sp. 4SK31]MDD9735490.1 hypothetical protein [Seohaeicola sp. SP36]MDF1708428.1 hypothetical protein [Paracoccaceae bacterium]MDM7970640.1 hypothetical protein [Paracoccaceae bacterium]